MRKILCALLMLVMFSSCSFANANVNPDIEVHRVIGGLYSLAASVCLSENSNPHVINLAAFFKDIPDNWQNNAKVERVNSSIWVGLSVNKYSEARHFLRDNAEALGIKESPEGLAWIGGDDAWIKACDIKDGKIKSLRLKAAKGSGKDSNVIFISTEGQMSWWQMNPTPKAASAEKIISRWGIKDAPELHKPEALAKTNSIYESVKPSGVIKKPANIHISTRKNKLDMSMNIGDVVFTPVPQLKHDRTTVEEIDSDDDNKTGSEQKQTK